MGYGDQRRRHLTYGARSVVPGFMSDTIGIAAGRGCLGRLAWWRHWRKGQEDGCQSLSIAENAFSLGKSAWNAFQDWNNQPLDLSAPGAAPNADFSGGVRNWGGTGGLLGSMPTVAA